MSKIFYSAKDFAAMKQRAEAAEQKLAATAEAFGETAKEEGFDLATAVKNIVEASAEEEDTTKLKADLSAAKTEADSLRAELSAIKSNPAVAATAVKAENEPGPVEKVYTKADLKKLVTGK